MASEIPERPPNAKRATMREGRMRYDSAGPWVRYDDYAAWRDHALRLENMLRSRTEAAQVRNEEGM